MSLADSILGALGGGGVVALARVAGKWIDGRKARARIDVEAAKVEAKREETGTHATERAFDAVKELLDEERAARRKDGESLRLEIEALRLENEELRHLLTEAQGVIAEMRAEVDRLRSEMLRSYVRSEPPVAIGRLKKDR